MATIKERVSLGEKILDKECPKWRILVDTKKLDMKSQSHCILGQIYGNFWSNKISMSLREAIEAGFGSSYADDDARADREYGYLTEEWRKRLTGM